MALTNKTITAKQVAGFKRGLTEAMIAKMVELLESKTGKKVRITEEPYVQAAPSVSASPSPEHLATENNIIAELQKVISDLDSLTVQFEIWGPQTREERKAAQAIQKVVTGAKDKINNIIQNETRGLDEDVNLDMETAMKKPDVLTKLGDKDIDVTLTDGQDKLNIPNGNMMENYNRLKKVLESLEKAVDKDEKNK
jgi:hypothetical protein